MQSDVARMCVQVAHMLEAAGSMYVIGGSVASTLHSEPRTTVDLDMMVRMERRQAAALEKLASAEFYVPHDLAGVIADAGSFNLLHHSGLKIDVFVQTDDLLDRLQMDRRMRMPGTDPPAVVWVTSPDVIVLRKLVWYRMGGCVSDRPWKDLVSVLAAQAGHLDAVEMEQLAARLGIGDLLSLATDAVRSENRSNPFPPRL